MGLLQSNKLFRKKKFTFDFLSATGQFNIYRTVIFHFLVTICNFSTPLIQKNKSIISHNFLLYQSELKQIALLPF